MSDNSSASVWVDPDDAPPLDAAWFANAHVFEGDRLVSRGRGRPVALAPKRQVTLRLDPDVLDHFKAGGGGWQTRINAALRKAMAG